MSDSFVTSSWSVACQAPLSMELSRQEYWSRLPFSSPGDPPDPGVEPVSLVPPALAGRFFTTGPTGKPDPYGRGVIHDLQINLLLMTYSLYPLLRSHQF